MSDDRASRLRERRRSSKARADDASEADESRESESSVDAAPEAGSSTADEATDTNEGSVKDEQVGTYMYLPESQKRELSRVFNVTKAEYEYEFDTEFEKNRHFYPLLVQYGIETLDDSSAVEVRKLLDDLHWN